MLQRIEMSFKESVRRNVQNGHTVKKLDTEAVKIATASACIDDLNTSVASTSFTVQLGRNEVENKDAYMRYWDFEKWMRKECLTSWEKDKFGKRRCNQLLYMCDWCHHVFFFRGSLCPSCDGIALSTSQGNYSSSSPMRMRLLKIILSVVEVTIYIIYLDYDLWSS
jgi:hypothetical protein